MPLFQPKRNEPRRYWLWLQHVGDYFIAMNIKVKLAATKYSCSPVKHHQNSAKHTDDGAANLHPALACAKARCFSAGRSKIFKLKNKGEYESLKIFTSERDLPHEESQDEGEDGNGRLNGGGIGGVRVAEANQEQQLVAKYATARTQIRISWQHCFNRPACLTRSKRAGG